MSEDLGNHIKTFPSDFDNTSIAQQLREENVPVRLYADIRDYLWNKLKEERLKNVNVMNRAHDMLWEIEHSIEEFKGKIE